MNTNQKNKEGVTYIKKSINFENLDSESKTVELDKSSDGKNEALLQ
tara:strand:+ start:102 stop:239 length:138 start_codon:yes stop_codon:yes gene_type:complete